MALRIGARTLVLAGLLEIWWAATEDITHIQGSATFAILAAGGFPGFEGRFWFYVVRYFVSPEMALYMEFLLVGIC